MKVEVRIFYDDGTLIEVRSGEAHHTLTRSWDRPLIEDDREYYGWLWQPNWDVVPPKEVT